MIAQGEERSRPCRGANRVTADRRRRWYGSKSTVSRPQSAAPTKAFREAPMSRCRRLKIEGGAFFCTLALADRGSDLLIRFDE